MPYAYMLDQDRLGETGSSYRAMLSHAREQLANRPPQAIAACSGVAFDTERSHFRVPSLGQTLVVGYPDGCVTFEDTDRVPTVFWALAALHYLSLADGTPLSGEPITFRMLRDGSVRGGNFDREIARIVRVSLGGRPIEILQRACAALGAEQMQSNADLCAVFPVFPHYPLTLQIWRADDEMPASGQILLDRSAEHYLSMEDSVSAGSLLLEFLEQQCRL